MPSIKPVLVAMSMLAANASVCAIAATTTAKHASTAVNATQQTSAIAQVDARFPRTAADASALHVPLANMRTDSPARALRPGAADAAAEEPSLPSGWLAAFIVVSLIGYQLRRKHRFLRPQRFTF